MDDSATVSARIPIGTKERLEKLAQATGRKRGFLIAQAVEAYLETQVWQVEETLRAIEEAKAQDFATDAEMRSFRAKWL